MRGFQASFSSGEISPLLHARVDLAKYATGLSRLENMIVLPQGGVTRRAGFQKAGNALHNEEVKLIPFEYNRTDSAILEIGEKNIRVWAESESGYEVKSVIESPYSSEEVKELRYVQSGNVMFLAHVNHKPMILKRESMRIWKLEELKYLHGPFISGSEWTKADVKLKISPVTGEIESEGGEIFSSGLEGTLIKVEYAVDPKTLEQMTKASPDESVSETIEVKGTLNVTTSGNWHGTIKIERSGDFGQTWVTLRQYVRADAQTQGQWDITITETEADILYRVKGQHETTEGTSHVAYTIETDDESGGVSRVISSGSGAADAAKIIISVSGFLKSEIYRIKEVLNGRKALTESEETVKSGNDETVHEVSLWSMGAWGNEQGYPKAVTMYQDRLIFAGTKYEPQTIWMSRTGDYADFGISDPLRDDDSVNITLAGTNSDGIHSIVSAGSLLAFTGSGEWEIRGSSENGAISPSALSARETSRIGSAPIQPLKVNGRIIIVQTQRRKVYALGYDLNTDGYSGSEISIMSAHMFEGKEITSMAYQQNPDSLLWFSLSDGTAAVCTYNPEHEVTGWSRQTNPEIRFESFESIPGVNQTEIFCAGQKGNGRVILCGKNREEESDYSDYGVEYESVMQTLRLSGAEEYASKKLAARLSVYGMKTQRAWASPKDWERRRRIIFEDGEGLQEAELELDNGFDTDACIQIRNDGNMGLTIAAISPVMTAGG